MFQTFLVEPLYNVLILILNYLPFGNLAVSVIILTIFVRLILFPISRNAIKSQIKIKEVQPQIKEIQEKYKNDQQTLALETMKIYRENSIKPFSSFLMILIQLPIIFALYFVFLKEGLPEINFEILYSFVKAPENINTTFWFIDITTNSTILALTAAVSQFLQVKIMMAKNNLIQGENVSQDEKSQMMNDVMKGMQLQMKYVMPVIMFFVANSLGAVIALYFTTSNIFSIFQELHMKKSLIDNKK